MSDETGLVPEVSALAEIWRELICRCQNPYGWHGCFDSAYRAARVLGAPTTRDRDLLMVIR